MFGLSKIEWLVLAGALLLCPGMSFGQAARGAAVPLASAAAGGSAAAASLFDQLDRNKDGYLTAAELASDEAKNRNWIAVDRDRDGRISRAEFGLVDGVPVTAQRQPSAAAGASAPKQE
jgi:EF hand domain-containing protein